MALHLKLCSSFSDALTQLYALIPTSPKSFRLFLIFIFSLSFFMSCNTTTGTHASLIKDGHLELETEERWNVDSVEEDGVRNAALSRLCF